MTDSYQTIVIGAGISGLAFARSLHRRGKACVVLERASRVGGRLATRYIAGEAVDYGAVFLQSSHADFLTLLKNAPCPATPWPTRVAGQGQPFQQSSFSPGVTQLAIAEGINRFPSFLADGLNVRCRSRVEALDFSDGHWQLRVENSPILRTKHLVLAVAAEQACALLQTLPSAPQSLQDVTQQLEKVRSSACLTLSACYPLDIPSPSWELLYPDSPNAVQLISFDSTKRRAPSRKIFVIQSRADWARKYLETDSDIWAAALLQEASTSMGDWALAPLEYRAHRWRYGRVGTDKKAALPAVTVLPHTAKLGLVGDYLSDLYGVEAAWRSAQDLAMQF